MVSIPLLLSLACWMFDGPTGAIPHHRGALYERAISKFLEWPETDRKWRTEPLQRPGLLAKLSEAAWELDLSDLFDDAAFAAKLGYSLSNAEEERKAIEIRDHLLRSGLLVRRAPGQLAFLHQTIQEYLAARYLSEQLAARPNWNPDRIGDTRWRGVWLFVALCADTPQTVTRLKACADQLIVGRAKFQTYLAWCQQKATETRGCYTPALRAFYFDLGTNRALTESDDFDSDLHKRSLSHLLNDCFLGLSCDARDRALRELETTPENCSALRLDRRMSMLTVVDRYLSRAVSTLDVDEMLVVNATVQYLVQTHRAAKTRDKSFASALEALDVPNLGAQPIGPWFKRFRAVAIRHRDIGRRWDFSPEETALLGRYYVAQQTLVECISTATHLDAAERCRILETLVLPSEDVSIADASALAKKEEVWAECEDHAIRANALMHDRSLAEAETAFNAAIPGLRELGMQHSGFLHIYTRYARKRGEVLHNSGTSRLAETIEAYRQVIGDCEESSRLDVDSELLREYALVVRNYGIALEQVGRLPEALQTYGAAIRCYRNLPSALVTTIVQEELEYTLRRQARAAKL